MEEEQDKVIIFPKWKQDLEKKAKQSMQDNRFQEAYTYFNQLTDNGVISHEVMTGKLICMMELNYYEEAEILCEQLIAKEDEYLSSYLHIYATLLFQSSKYKELMQLVEDTEEKQQLVSPMHEQLQHMYQLSQELQQQEDQKSYIEVMDKLKEAVLNRNDRQQWYMIKRLLELNVKKDIPLLKDMLKDSGIHPVVKTAILEYFIESDRSEKVIVEKFNLTYEFVIHNKETVFSSTFFSGVFKYLEDVQQNDPTSFQMIQFILQRFAYVYAPFLPEEENYEVLASALLYYVNQSLGMDRSHDRVDTHMFEHHVKMIDTAEKLYGTLLDI
ncbi:hypothetical protein [Gracilibacillus sp. YIM 98692]|uniref:hypothetical protein n=1 Tax=Gracilibacillus sp. YIM 98692 TaxID=2663532 RepID=UPI0013D200B0|nr:hypothetical protein [Gracilibacillus sp. YIM 98692]